MNKILYILFFPIWLVAQNQPFDSINILSIKAIFIDGQWKNFTNDTILLNYPGDIAILLKKQNTNTYRYYLDGADEFYKTNNFPVVVYQNLKEGIYHFYTSNNQSTTNKLPQIVIQVTEIERSLFKSWSFLPLLMLYLAIIFGGAGYFIVISHVRNKRKISDLRNDWTNKLHNDIGGDLSSITMRLGNMPKQLNEANPVIKKNILNISKITVDIQKKLRFLFDLIDPKKNSLHIILEDLYSFANDNCKMKGMKLNYENNLNPSEYYNIDIGRINKLYLIIKEAINNCSKHSKASNLFFIVKSEQKSIDIMIVDDGIGFNYPSASAGNGIDNLKEYSKLGVIDINIKSKLGEGTTILVSVPYI